MLKYLYTERLTYGVSMALLLVAGSLLQGICFWMSLMVDESSREMEPRCAEFSEPTDRAGQLLEVYCLRTAANIIHAEVLMYKLGLASNWCLILAIYFAYLAYRPVVVGSKSVTIIKP
eukprot:TRINITY_DN11064_c0_g1_i1.p1 TRINITY_DN11064_c0_g1~~TRINITY_DN11064_c0_g1_i1.p1  ORF type:complete len:126 (+),score=19.65 TRINITY_DN11064_c0_g1_i1:27-380(+)